MHFNLNYTPHFHVGLLNSSLQEKKSVYETGFAVFWSTGS